MEFLYIAFGWLLGLLGGYATEVVRRRRRSALFRETVLFELFDLQIRLVLVYYNFGLKRGKLSLRDFDWINKTLLDYEGPLLDEALKKLVAKAPKISDEELSAVLKSVARPEQVRSAVKKYSLPCLQSVSDTLHYMKPSVVRELHEILNQINIYNELVDEHRAFFSKTFESGLSKQNYKILEANLSTTEQQLTHAAKTLAERIEKVRCAI